MAILPTPTTTETDDDRTPLEPGRYVATIVKSEMKKTKANTGHYLSLRFKVAEGPKKGRLVFTNLNLDNPNPVAVEIANKQLNSIKVACGFGVTDVEDSEELHGIPMELAVTISPGNAQYPPSNEISGYYPYDGEVAEEEEAAEEVIKPWV